MGGLTVAKQFLMVNIPASD